MTLLDFSKNCDITTNSFSDDLLSYSLQDNRIFWEDNTTANYTIRQDLFQAGTSDEFWTPTFISDDDLIINKLISHYGSIIGDSSFSSGRIGIENFITFTPKFKNWNVNNGLMVVDWILNRSRTPYNIKAGLMYWKRKRAAVTGKLTFFPIYTKIKYNNILFVKIDNETIRQISPNPVRQALFRQDASLSFEYTNQNADIKIADLRDPDPTFVLDGSDEVELWIPDGDQILYFTNISEEKQNNIQGIASRSYVSGSLYKYYNILYNSLTAREKLGSITEFRSTNRLRQYKKLAHAISTSPFISEFFVSLLAKPSEIIKNSIDLYLASNIESIDTDINNLSVVLRAISQEYSNYEIQNNSNIIKNNDQLFLKLYNKYGAKLQLSNDASINYRPRLTYGDSAIVEEIGETLTTKEVTEAVIANSKVVTIGNLSVETSTSPVASRILLKHKGDTTNEIALYDSVKPDFKESSNINILMQKNNNVDDFYKKDPSTIPVIEEYDPNNTVFYWGPKGLDNAFEGARRMEQWRRYCPALKVVNIDLLIKYINSRFPTQTQEMINGDFVCVWTKVSGPDLKFVDLNKTASSKSYNVAYSNEVLLVPSSTGKYVIKCVVSSPYGSYTKIKTIFIVDGREQIEEKEPTDQNPNPPKIDNPNFATYSRDGLDDVFSFGTFSIDDSSKKTFSSGFIDGDTRININNSNINEYRTENIPIKINKDKLSVFIAGLNSFAIHRNGLYVPIRTNHYIERVNANSRPIEKLNSNYAFTFDKTAQESISPKINNSSLIINYALNNTVIKLDRIILRNIRNENKECSQCYSMYQPKFTSFIGGIDKRPFFSRSQKNPEGFSLQKYLSDINGEPFPEEVINYFYPPVSSNIAPPVSSYGGYGYEVLDRLPLNTLDSLKKPDRNISNNGHVANSPEFLPNSIGYKLDYKDDFENSPDGYKLCYQQHVMPSGYLEFDKGTFVPNSGWVMGDGRNLSSVLKFNPGARKSFSFLGPGILGITNYTNTNTLSTNTFSSSIELNINPSIQWDTGGLFCPKPVPPQSNEIANRNELARIRGIHNMKNQLIKELPDQYFGGPNNYHHGYRILNGGNPKRSELNLNTSSVPQNDEFNIEINESANKFTYSFNVVGPNEKIGALDEEAKEFIELYQFSGVEPGNGSEAGLKVRTFIETRNGLQIRNPRINNLTINDVEIKLNFLNYVNTKNLVVWLEVAFSEVEKGSMSLIVPERGPPVAPAQIRAKNNFIDQFVPNDTYKGFTNPDQVINRFFISENIDTGNETINQNLRSLTDMNSRDVVGDNVILYLLNQETIQNKDYNFSIKFSDSANKHNVLYDQNLYSSGVIDPDQNIISNNNSVNPSQHSNLRDTFTNSNTANLNKLNRLNINNNTFHKLAGRSLFNGVHPGPVPEGCNYLFNPYDGSTIFTLHMSILEEPDEMFPIDTLVNNELYTNISSVENTISSANLFNNLCSWELILHTENVKKPVTSQVNSLANYGGTDSLSLIEYGVDPKYPGYSFIANLKDSKFLLPLVNMNAPTTFFQNYNACEYADSELIGKGALINQPRFPTEALISILAGTAVGGMTGSLAGALVGGLGPTYSLGFQMLFDYFKESRQVPVLEAAQRETFDIEYESYPFGNSDKILLNISKDGVFWYKVEASIFKLSNTPALPLKEYAVIKNDSKLFKFDFNTLSSMSEIIREEDMPIISAKIIDNIKNQIQKEKDKIQADLDDDPPPDTATATRLRERLSELDAEREQLDIDIQNKEFENLDSSVYLSSRVNFVNVDELLINNKLIHSENIFQYIKQPNQTLIIIDHTIPYYVISIGDSIKLDCEDRSAIIMSKALIYKDSKYQTVLALNKSLSDLSGCSALLLPEDVVVICAAESTIETNQSAPISLFGLVSDQPPNDTIPDLTFSTNSLGSYGDGSSVKDKNILSRKVQINNIESIYDQLNSFNNDKYYYNQLSLVLPSGDNKTVMAPNVVPTGVDILINSKLESYPVYYDTTTNNIVNNNFYHVYDNTFNNSNATDNRESIRALLDNIGSSKDNRTYTKDHPNNMIYLKVKDSNIIKQLYRNTIGSITIENNYTYNDTIERINSDQFKTLTDRLAVLNKTSDPSLDSLVGNTTSTSRVLESASIFYIQQHYDSLPEDAPDCSRTPPNITCYKHRTYSKLQQLYGERSDILHLLSQQTVKDDNDDYILDPIKQKYHTGEGGIIPDQKANININTDKSLTITYESVSDHYYWINIDPKQSIGIAEEMRPKILKSIKYICQNTNPVFSTGGAQLGSFNNVCPDWIRVNGLENDMLKITADSTGTTYAFKDGFVEQQKSTWKDNVLAWGTQTIERRFRINAENSIPGGLNRTNDEFLVTAIETYEIGLDTIEAYRKNGQEAGLSDREITDLLLEENIIKSDLEGSFSFIAQPTRVYNIFNLDDINKLKVQFRKAPRTMRGIDAIGTILRYGENMSYRPQNRPPLDPLDAWGVGRTESLINNFYQWKCLQKDPINNKLADAQTPEFFQLLNEMIFRTFFGSVDGIENKNNQLRSLYDFEMIPYEYFTKSE